MLLLEIWKVHQHQLDQDIESNEWNEIWCYTTEINYLKNEIKLTIIFFEKKTKNVNGLYIVLSLIFCVLILIYIYI